MLSINKMEKNKSHNAPCCRLQTRVLTSTFSVSV